MFWRTQLGYDRWLLCNRPFLKQLGGRLRLHIHLSVLTRRLSVQISHCIERCQASAAETGSVLDRNVGAGHLGLLPGEGRDPSSQRWRERGSDAED